MGHSFLWVSNYRRLPWERERVTSSNLTFIQLLLCVVLKKQKNDALNLRLIDQVVSTIDSGWKFFYTTRYHWDLSAPTTHDWHGPAKLSSKVVSYWNGWSIINVLLKFYELPWSLFENVCQLYVPWKLNSDPPPWNLLEDLWKCWKCHLATSHPFWFAFPVCPGAPAIQ